MSYSHVHANTQTFTIATHIYINVHTSSRAHTRAHMDTRLCRAPPQTHISAAQTHGHAQWCEETCLRTDSPSPACAVCLIANTWASAGRGLSQPFEAEGLVAPLPVSAVRK